MSVLISLLAVLALFLLAFFGAQSEALRSVLGVVLPYAAAVVFVGGVVWRILSWARSPVPFRIPTTCGQQQSLRWIKADCLDNPHSLLGVMARMALEILFFRSLFRNTRTSLTEGPKVVYAPTKWLWLGAMAFHWSMLIILLRHLRFFSEPVPNVILALQTLDGFFQAGLPIIYVTTLVFVAALGYLLLRRLWIPQVRYISLANDYFPLFLLLGVGLSGLLLRHYFKTDIEGVKELTLGLLSLRPTVSDKLHGFFFGHLMLVCALVAYLPFSKLMHMGGVFLSPTRNLANNNRAVRHINPWNHPVDVHTYEEYEDEFRARMIEAGIPVDRKE